MSDSADAAIPQPVLRPVSFADISDKVSFDQEIWQRKFDILHGIEDNLSYLNGPNADVAYSEFEKIGISRSLVEKSLRRFHHILLNSESSDELREYLMHEFLLYKPVGNDGFGTVRFTGYFQPTYKASRIRTNVYRYPVYKLPENFSSWAKPHPPRVFLEGWDGLGNPSSPLYGHELVWLKSRYEAFMIHVQGSAILDLTDGTQMAIGFAAGTEHPFRGISKQFMKDKGISWTQLNSYFATHPEDLNECLARNNRFIMFKENESHLPIGSLGVPVIPERSMATDKKILPPGALGLIHAKIPHIRADGSIQLQRTSRFVLDQDTGSAIKGPGRVDLFMGTGPEAQRKANHVYADGQLYYLLLKE